jgi:hypothetical protein
MRIRREHFDGLLDPEDARDVFLGQQVTECRIKHGEIQVEESSWSAPRVLAEYPGIFLSFARLGGSVQPRPDSIRTWVRKHGLPKRTAMPEGKRKAYMLLEDFREEARYAHQMLKLYAEIRGQEIKALKARTKNPQTPLDEALRDAFNSRDHRMLLGLYGHLKDEVRLFMSMRVLTEAVNEKLDQLRPRLRALSGYTVVQSWYCPDLLTAMYLQLYLLITDYRPMSYCEFCGVPFPQTRANRRYCTATCRSKARYYR